MNTFGFRPLSFYHRGVPLGWYPLSRILDNDVILAHTFEKCNYSILL
jgi:hypothetical protein